VLLLGDPARPRVVDDHQANEPGLLEWTGRDEAGVVLPLEVPVAPARAALRFLREVRCAGGWGGGSQSGSRDLITGVGG
jgi:hypothetical protein